MQMETNSCNDENFSSDSNPTILSELIEQILEGKVHNGAINKNVLLCSLLNQCLNKKTNKPTIYNIAWDMLKTFWDFHTLFKIGVGENPLGLINKIKKECH